MWRIMNVLPNYIKGLAICSSNITNIQILSRNCLRTSINQRSINLKTVIIRSTTTAATLTIPKVKLNSNKIVGYWLLSCSGLVFGAVVLGGVTRLTESGLSIVHWKLLGEKLPRSEEEWKLEFEKYKLFPEFKMKNSTISLEEFKWIWWMEYTHRMWGRIIGASFLLPAAYFWRKGKFSPEFKKRIVVFSALIAAQGLMGWFMVQSGLEDKFHKQDEVVRVSQYRLASHLGLALILYSGLLFSALDILLPVQNISISTKSLQYIKRLVYCCKGFIFLTAISGAFVAGLDAGLVYNSFPKMGDDWIPKEMFSIKPFLKNFTENPVTVQFNHRVLGSTTFALISTLWILSFRKGVPRRIFVASNVLAGFACIQVTLGITTLLNYVPTALAAMHQSGSLFLLTVAIWLAREAKYLKRIAK